MTYEHIRYENRGAVAVISYDKQERLNARSPPLYRETEQAIESANEDEEVVAIVLTHEGPIFCAGTDFKAGPEVDPDTGGKLNIAQICMMQDKGWINLLVRSKPMVGAVHGAAIGLGVTQLLPMALRIGGVGDRRSGVEGRSVSVGVALGGRRIITKKQNGPANATNRPIIKNQ